MRDVQVGMMLSRHPCKTNLDLQGVFAMKYASNRRREVVASLGKCTLIADVFNALTMYPGSRRPGYFLLGIPELTLNESLWVYHLKSRIF